MKRFLKIAGIVLTLVVVVVVSLLVAVPLLVDPNDYREPIEDMVKERTGRELTIEGDLELSVFPWLGLKIGAVRLANAEGFGEQPFASVSSAQARVRLLPLIGGDIRVGTLAVADATVRLARNEQGEDNWSSLLERLTEPAAQAEQTEQPAAEGAEGAAALAGLTIDELRVTDTRVELRDAAAGTRYRIGNGRLTADGIAFGKAFPVELEAELASDAPAATVGALVTGELMLDPAEQKYSVTDLRLAGDLAGEAVPGGEQQIEARADASADLAGDTASLEDLSVKAAGVTLSGRLKLSELSATPGLDGTLEIAELSPRAVLDTLGMEPPETADPDVLSVAALETDVGGTLVSPELSALWARLDDTQVTGNVTADLSGSVPALSGKLDVTDLNVDRYMPPEQDTAAGSPGAAAGALPFEMLRSVDLDLDLTAQQLMTGGLKVVNVVTEIELDGGRLRIHPLEAGLYDGVYTGDIRVDARPDRMPSLAVSEQIEDVSLGPLTEAVMDQRYITGTGNVRADLTASGSEIAALERTLNGNVRFEAADGKIIGVDVLRKLRASYDRIRGNEVETAQGEETTDYSSISASAKIANGVAVNRDMQAKSPLIEASGEGEVNLVEDTIDYTTRVTVLGTGSGTADDILGRLKGTPIPIRITGPLDGPSIRPDVRAALKSQAGEKIEEKAKDLGDKIEEKAGEKLKGLFD